MKKCVKNFILFMIAVALIISFCSCGIRGKEPTDNTAKNQDITSNLIIKNVNSIDTGSLHTVAVRTDGTVVATGNNEYGQCNVSDWTDIVSISASGNFTVGLKQDGTVVAVGANGSGQCNVSDWTDIVSITTVVPGCYAVGGSTIGVKKDGTVIAIGEIVEGNSEYGYLDVTGITNVAMVSASYNHAVFLKRDGTVFAVGDNSYGKCNVNGWTDIVKVVTGDGDTTIGLKKDGTVVATGCTGDDGNSLNVGDWKNVTDIGGFECFVLGVSTTDGALCTWEDVDFLDGTIAVTAEADYVVGLLPNGTLVAWGDNSYGQTNVSGWTNIKINQ